jgi:hypothetical protein
VDICSSLQFLDPELGRNESPMTVGGPRTRCVNVLPGGTVSLFDRGIKASVWASTSESGDAVCLAN